jgi:hypothetical protein
MSRMRGDIPPLPQYLSMAWFLVKHRDKFIFTLVIENNNYSNLLLPVVIFSLLSSHLLYLYLFLYVGVKLGLSH